MSEIMTDLLCKYSLGRFGIFLGFLLDLLLWCYLFGFLFGTCGENQGTSEYMSKYRWIPRLVDFADMGYISRFVDQSCNRCQFPSPNSNCHQRDNRSLTPHGN